MSGMDAEDKGLALSQKFNKTNLIFSLCNIYVQYTVSHERTESII
jgi:hypothetical protein